MSSTTETFTVYVLTPPSLNGEKTRWVLNYKAVNFIDHQLTLAPLSLIPALRYACKAKGSKFVYAVHEQGTPVFRDAEKLADYFDSLNPEKDRFNSPLPDAIKSQYDDNLTLIDGAIRHWSYGTFGCESTFFKQIMTHNVPATEKLFFYGIYPLLKQLFKIQFPAKEINTMIAELNRGLDQFDLIFADGRQFINAEHFSYADIDLAVTLSPMIMPPEYCIDGLYPAKDQMPSHIKEMVEATRQRPTGQYILNLYKNLRKPIIKP